MPDQPSGGAPSRENNKTRVGGYEIISKIGQGAMGAVFKARQVSMDRVVALKILPPALAKDSAFLERFLREARAAAQLNHPNIVQAYDAGMADGYSYFAMEFVDGNSLQTVLKVSGALEEHRALEITRDIAQALDCAHNAGIVHRDVKPDNILLAPDGTAKLADLGIARRTGLTDSSLTQAGATLGTPNYIAPEQVRGEPDIDGRADIYSLGATLYHMLTGASPYAGGTSAEVMSKHLTQPVPDVRKAVPRVSPRTNVFIKKAMAKNRANRYATAKEFLDDLAMLLSDSSLTVTAAPKTVAARDAAPKMVPEQHAAPIKPDTVHEHPPRPVPRLSPGKIGAIAGISLAVLMAAILGVYALTRDSGPPAKTVKDRRQLAAVEAWVQQHPGQYLQALAKYRDLRRVVTDPECKQKTETALADIEAARARAAEATFREIEAKARELKRKGAYAGAIKAYRDLSPEFTGLLIERAEQAMRALKAEGAAEIKQGLDRAKACLDKGDPVGGLAELDKISHIQHSALRDAGPALRQKLERARFEKALAARKKISRLLDAAEAGVKKDLTKAARAVQAAANAPEFQIIKPSAESLARIGDALLEAGRDPRRAFAAGTADEQIAAAILALVAEDPAKMADAVRRAGDHEFGARYATKLEQLKERLQERETDRQQQQRLRLAELRRSLPAALKKHQYEQLAAELDKLIADRELPLVREEATADRRAISKLVSLLRRIRSNVRVEAGKAIKTPTRRKGIPATIEAYDSQTDTVKFSTGAPEVITSMRAMDLKMLLDLNPGPPAEYHERLALLFIAEGEAQKAWPHIPKAADQKDIKHLTKILGVAAAEGDGEPADEPADMAGLTDTEKEALQRALAKSRSLFKSYSSMVSREREARKDAYQLRMADQWSEANYEVRYLQGQVEQARANERRYRSYSYSYSYSRSYYRRRRIQLEGQLNEAIRTKSRLAEKIRATLAEISRRAGVKKTALRTAMLRHKRLLLTGKEITEEQMKAAYEKVMRGN